MMTVILIMMMVIIIIIIVDLKPKWAMASFGLFSSVCLSFYPPVSAYDIQLLPGVALAILLTRFSTLACEGGEVVSLTQTANVEQQAPVFMYPEDRVARLYPQSPDSSDISVFPLSVTS
jgi:hypothetical protein